MVLIWLISKSYLHDISGTQPPVLVVLQSVGKQTSDSNARGKFGFVLAVAC